MYAVRRWSVRHPRLLSSIYAGFERLLVSLDPLFRRIGYERLERPVAAVERTVKGFLFDCRMCGHCVLTSTGMSCPMNCPKNLRNGPCGGVRPNGHCEVEPNMRCVWVEAWEGSRNMVGGEPVMSIQPPLDFSLQGRSSWLDVAREKAAGPRPGTGSGRR